jgi:hypothetical protein
MMVTIMGLPQDCDYDIAPVTKCNENVIMCISFLLSLGSYEANGCDQKVGVFCIYVCNVLTVIKLQTLNYYMKVQGSFIATEFCSL